MILPMAVEVREGAGYIRYLNDKPAGTIGLMKSCSVAADVNADRSVIGIEILDVKSPEPLLVAQRFALEHNLGFPRDLTGFTAMSWD